jgi:hypothetical protein
MLNALCLIRQLYENYRNSSCEGLSIVFLAQWMAGDVTNLVGCLLTKQLPFQIAVATYFCGIDLCILVQYFRESALAPLPLLPLVTVLSSFNGALFICRLLES